MKAPIPRARGPEAWTTLRGETVSHWDLWLLVAAVAKDNGWDGVVAKLEARRRGTHGWHDAEAKECRDPDAVDYYTRCETACRQRYQR